MLHCVPYLLQQAIFYILDFTRWEFLESLLKANILAPLNTIISTSAQPDLCSSATRVVALLGSWEHIQFFPDPNKLQPYSIPICSILLTALTNSASAVSVGLNKFKSPAWVHGSSSGDEYKYMDSAVSAAVDTLNGLFPVCDADVKQEVLNAVSLVAKAGALSDMSLSLKATVGFMGRQYHIKGVPLSTQKPRAACPKLAGSEAIREMVLASTCMTWFQSENYCTCDGANILNDLFQENHSMWTAEVLGQAISYSMILPSTEWPGFLAQNVSLDCFADMISRTPDSQFEDEDLMGAAEFMYSCIMPRRTPPWEPPPESEDSEVLKKGWSDSKECHALETTVMLAALEAGALRFSIRANGCETIQSYTSQIFEHLTGANPDGHTVLTRLRASASWPKAMPHLVEAAQQLLDIAFAQLAGASSGGQGEEAGGDEEGEEADPGGDGEDPAEDPSADPAEGDENDEEGEEEEEPFTNPWPSYKIFDAVKFFVEVSALHQHDLKEFDPKKPDPSPVAGVASGKIGIQTAFASKHAILKALHAMLQKVVVYITDAIEEGGLEGAVYVAPIIVALLGQFLDSDGPLTYNADVLLRSGVVDKICLHMQPPAAPTEDDDDADNFFQLMVVLSVLARRNPEGRVKLMNLGTQCLPMLMKRAANDPPGAWSVVEFVGYMACSDEVHSSMKKDGIPSLLMQILKVRTQLCHYLGLCTAFTK